MDWEEVELLVKADQMSKSMAKSNTNLERARQAALKLAGGRT